MELTEECMDDVLNKLYNYLLDHGTVNKGTRGNTIETLGLTLRLSNPRARISRSNDRGKLFSAIGELLWYLSKSDKLDYIEPFVPLYKQEAIHGVIPGAYGPRLFNMRGETNQIENVTSLLQSKPTTKRAVIQLFNAEDLNGTSHHETPCTTTLQFHQRNSKLHLSVTMRSNDAYYGLPHDVFCFTMLQEMLARRLAIDVGEYIHHVGSMHIYEKHIANIKHYIKEGFHKIEPMPAMPSNNPFDYIPILLEANEKSRGGRTFQADELIADDYWADIIRLIQAFWSSGDRDKLKIIATQLSNQAYSPYVLGLAEATPKTDYMTS